MQRHLVIFLGFALSLVLALAAPAQPPGFPSVTGMVSEMDAAAKAFPKICQLVNLTAKYSTPKTHQGRSIYAVKISDNVGQEEDEPAFLMVAAHHGNEYGTPIVPLDAISRLTKGYGKDPAITALVDRYEIWIAPLWNVDGYHTSRHNRRPGGTVDLNRNYPFLWSSACNTGVKGPSAGSEPETKTMIAWSEDQQFTKVLDYHSSGRETLHGYRCNQHQLRAYLQREAIALSTASSYGGRNRGPSSNGEHYQWQLGNFSNYAFLTEISNTQRPTRASADAEATRLWPGTVWMLQRPIPVWGHVIDAVSRKPLMANISYVENPFTQGERNRSEPLFGRYHAFLPNGRHTLRFAHPGYVTQDVPVTVTSGGVQVEIALVPHVVRFGRGCSDSLGRDLRLDFTGEFRVARRVDLSVNSAVARPAIVIAGASDRFWGSIPLPFDLGLIGATSCRLWVAFDIVVGTIPATGRLGINVPNNPVIAGQTVFWQAWMHDPAIRRPTPIATSDALRTTIAR
jgi:hypothetical protein